MHTNGNLFNLLLLNRKMHRFSQCFQMFISMFTSLDEFTFTCVLIYFDLPGKIYRDLWLKCGLWQCWDLRTLKDFAWFHEQLGLNLYHLPWFHCLLRSISSAHNSKNLWNFSRDQKLKEWWKWVRDASVTETEIRAQH